jgi:ribosomal protein S18 acetylase RimI-like enzyme
VKYEASHGIDVNYKKISLLLSNEDEEIIGVINAYTAFAEVYLDDMWVSSKERGKGYGKMLIEALKAHFKGKGFNNINLVTSQFQAPKFYESCGFQLEFIRKNDTNPKFTKYFYIYFFEDEIQKQGLL